MNESANLLNRFLRFWVFDENLFIHFKLDFLILFTSDQLFFFLNIFYLKKMNRVVLLQRIRFAETEGSAMMCDCCQFEIMRINNEI